MKGKSSLKCRDCSIFGSLLAAAADWHDKFPLKPKKRTVCVSKILIAKSSQDTLTHYLKNLQLG